MSFLNLSDAEGKLSITNTAVIVLITKIAVAPSLDFPTVAALLLSLLNYADKRRTIAANSSTNEQLDGLKEQIEGITEAAKKIEEVESKVNSLILRSK